jgi:hypothetical protein
MLDDERDALLTPRGREEKLRELELRVDALETERTPRLEGRVTAIEGKEASRDKRWDFAFKSIVTIAGGLIIAIVTALITTGVHL